MAESVAELTKAEVERYSRQLVLPELGPEGQRKLRGSSVLIVGAGGLGIPASVYLAAAGVGKIGVVDDDEVEKSNLHRQTLYSEADVGRPKALVAAEKLRLVNPYVSISPYEAKLDSSNAMQIIERYDVVVDCTDNFPARYLINDACVLLHKPDVYASVFRFDGQVSVFDSRKGPCYRCLFSVPPPPDAVQDCAVAGVLGVLPGIMGSIQAVQTVNLLLGRGVPLTGRLVLFDANEMTFNELKVKKNPACPICGNDPTIRGLIDYEEFCGTNRPPPAVKEISAIDLKRLIDAHERLQILDVREQQEFDLCRIEGSTLIPLGELEKRAGELSKDAKVVAICQMGGRSARAVEILSSMGFDARNLKGGLRAWADDVDTSMPVY